MADRVTSEEEQIQRSWIANADAWRDAVREHRIASRAVTDPAIVSAVLETNSRRALDLGCGEGWLARALSAQGIEVTGVDASAPLIEAAKALGGAAYLCMSYEEIARDPSPLGTGFDAVVANFSLLDDHPEPLLRALSSTLADDGRLIMQTLHPCFADPPYRDGWRTETFSSVPGEWRESMPWFFRTIGSWTAMFLAAGYTVAEIREPLHADRPVPASIVFVCRRR